MLKNKGFIVLFFTCFFTLLFNHSFSQTLKKLKTIIVDAGHGGSDAGATGTYEHSLRSREKDITLAISKKLVVELKKQLPDLNIVPTRTTDIFQNPREKADIANQAKGELFICIHADAVNLKTGRRQIGSKTVTRYRITYKGKGRKKMKISTPYTGALPGCRNFKIFIYGLYHVVWGGYFLFLSAFAFISDAVTGNCF